MIVNPGTEWSSLECDALALRYIPIKLLSEESALYETKFWDYRFMHPVQATCAYAQAYSDALKRAVSRRTDLYVGLNMRGLKKPIIFELDQRTLTGLWKGRQMADRIGCPYDFYCEVAMQFADRARMPFLPSSSQMYSTTVAEHLQVLPSMVEHIVSKWVERTSHSAFYAAHEAYTCEHYCEGPDQVEYLNKMLGRMNGHSMAAGILMTLMEKGQVNAEQVLFAMPRSGPDLLARVERLCR